MKTLIELYDERPLENVLGPEVFSPERVVYICPEAVAGDDTVCKTLLKYFRHRGFNGRLIFTPCHLYNSESVLTALRSVVSHYPDCALDITGGSDAALFAAGLLCSENKSLPVFTYSRRRNTFYSIRNADFADALPCPVEYQVEDCFLMAGGEMREGRFNNALLARYIPYIDPFFNIFLRFQNDWVQIVTWFQRVSASPKDVTPSLSVSGSYQVKGERGSRIDANEDALRAFEELGFISDLNIVTDNTVSFTFKDQNVRTWLRDVGAVLELYVFKACTDTGLFTDVITSAVVDWEKGFKQFAVTNELDVMATRGVTPLFISCKTCDVKTEALNELAILRDRFGGSIAKAAIVTAEKGNSTMRHRAVKLGIDVIDIEDIKGGNLAEHLQALMTD